MSANISEAVAPIALDVEERLGLLRRSMGRVVDRPVEVRRSRELRGRQPGFDAAVWQRLADLGWLGTLVPEELGGLGLDCADAAVIAEGLGAALYPEPFTAVGVFAAGCLVHGDNEELKAKLLPDLVRGAVLPSVAWREDGHEGDPLRPASIAVREGGVVRLHGAKRLAIAGAVADGFIVSAAEDGELGLYWVPAASVANSRVYRVLPDGRPSADVLFDGVEVPASHVVASAKAASAALTRAYDEALIVTSAELLGLCEAVLEITLEYLRTRVQFGKHIGSFQSLQHRAVDLYVQLRMSRHALDEVVAILTCDGVSPQTRSAQASRIKARCADTSLLITREAVQMHGAIGYSDECDVGLYLKRAIVLSAWLGGGDVHRRRFARIALGLPAGA